MIEKIREPANFAPMRIGIIGDALDTQYGGIYYFTKNFITSLLAIDRVNEYVVFRAKEGDENFACKQVILKPFKWLPMNRALRIFLRVPYLTRKLHLDVLIEPAHFGPFNLPKRTKRVTVIHDLTPILFNKWHKLMSWVPQFLFLPTILRRTDLIITNSDYTKSDIVNHLKISADKIVTSHLGISEKFKRTNEPAILGKYGIYKDYILYQGTLEPRKNLVKLIEGYELYRQMNPDSKEQLILAGKEGWKIKELLKKKNVSQFKDDIVLLGYVDRNDMPAIYSGARVFAYPSLYEGFGLPVLEAMACGTPVVTSNTSSLPEIGGQYAIYFDPNDPVQIGRALIQAVKMPKDNIQDQIDYAVSYTWAKTASRVLEAINELS